LPLQWFRRHGITATVQDVQGHLGIYYRGYGDREDRLGAIQQCEQVLTPIGFRYIAVVEDYVNSVGLANMNRALHRGREQHSPTLLNRTDAQIVLNRRYAHHCQNAAVFRHMLQSAPQRSDA
jgi:hypothetical protein